MDYHKLRDDLVNLKITTTGIYGEDPIWAIGIWRAPSRNAKLVLHKELVIRSNVADFFDIQYVPWYEAEKGQWGISDDNMVMPCNKYYVMKDKRCSERFTRKVFHYPVSRRFCSYTDGKKTSKEPFNVLEFLATGNLGGHSPLSRSQRWIKQRHVQKGLYLWAKMYYLRGGKLGYGDCQMIMDRLRPRKKKEINDPQAYVDWFIGKHVEIRNYAGLMLKKIFEENGLGADKAADMLLETFGVAKNNKDAKVMHEVSKTVLGVHETPTHDVSLLHVQTDVRRNEVGFEKLLDQQEVREIGVSEEDYKDAVNNMEGGVEMVILANEHALS